ncbi:MAG: hypothetical protein V2A79_08555 [Planctomycetota bacterium]
MIYAKNQPNPVFVVPLIDQYGNPVTGVTMPTVCLSKDQGATATLVPWVEGTDFTWHELADGEKCKGLYKLRQVNNPNASAVDTAGTCVLSVVKTDHNTAAGAVAYQVEDRSASGPVPAAVAEAVWNEAIDGHATEGTFGEELHVAKAMLANKRVHAVATGVDVVKDNDGTTTLRTMTPSDGGEDIIITPS